MHTHTHSTRTHKETHAHTSVQVQGEAVCETGMVEEAEAQWREDAKVRMWE